MDLQFLPLLLIAGLALLLILNFRRQRRVIADAQRLQNSLANGDRVMTTSGLHATVVSSPDETTVELDDTQSMAIKSGNLPNGPRFDYNWSHRQGRPKGLVSTSPQKCFPSSA
jgi:preprotein translocase YajC subunit